MGAADQIAARGTIGAGVTHATNTDLIAIVRTGRKLNRLLGGHTDTPAAAAIGAGIGDDLTGTAALGADRLKRAGAKQERQVDVDVAATAAARTGMCMLGRNRARTSAVTTGIEARIADGLAGTALGLLGVELDIDDHVGATLGVVGRLAATGLAPGAPEGETAVKGIAVPGATGVAAAIGRSRRSAGEGIARAHGVVARTLLLVRKHGIGLGNLFELFLGIRFFVDVRMELAGLLLEGLLYITRGGVLGNTQNLVIIFFVHRRHARQPPAHSSVYIAVILPERPKLDPKTARTAHFHRASPSGWALSGRGHDLQ